MVRDYNMELERENEASESFNLESVQKPKNKNSKDEVRKDMLIAEIVEQHPELVPVIMDYGVHCVNCGAAMFETLEEGFMGHGMSDEDVDKTIKELNDYIKENSKSSKK
jgi:hybrid cluster-associated redox disulfide protein